MTSRTKKFCCCATCLKPLLPEDKYIECSRASCKKLYHIDICIGVAIPVGEDVGSWVCPTCVCETKKGTNKSSASIRCPAQTPDVNITSRPKKNLPQSDFKELTGEIRFLREEMLGLKSNMETIMASSVRFDERIEELLTRLAANDEKVSTLRACYETENASLKQRVVSLEEQINNQAQASLRNQIEIVGIPETPTENLYHVALVAAKKVGVDMVQDDIDWIERAGPRRVSSLVIGDSRSGSSAAHLPRPIVLKLTRRVKRDELLKSAKSRKPVIASDLGVGEQPTKVYFNERLTRENRLLFRETRKRALEAGFKFCWTSNGFINIRRREGSPAIRIRSVEELAVKLRGSSAAVGV